jgi:hypothetical protein
MQRKNLALTRAALLSIIFVASAFLPALAEAPNFYALLENRTDDTVSFEAEWSNRAGTWHSGFQRYSIGPRDNRFFESPCGAAKLRVRLKGGSTYGIEGVTNTLAQGATCTFKYDQDNVVLIRVK